MNPASLQARSLLVKTQPDRERAFVLEDLRTGHRCEFDSLAHLLDSLTRVLQMDRPQDEERTDQPKTSRGAASAPAKFDSKGEHHENAQ